MKLKSAPVDSFDQYRFGTNTSQEGSLQYTSKRAGAPLDCKSGVDNHPIPDVVTPFKVVGANLYTSYAIVED